MPQMRVANITDRFHAHHAIAFVDRVGDRIFFDWCGKTGPARATFKLGRGIK